MGKFVVGAVVTIGIIVGLLAYSGHKMTSHGGSPREANDGSAGYIMRSLNTAEANYASLYAARGYAASLAALGPGQLPDCKRGEGAGTADNACLIDDKDLAGPQCSGEAWCAKNGYQFRALCPSGGNPCSDYLIVAKPADENSGSKNYCSTSDAVVHVRPAAGDDLAQLTAAQCHAWPAL